MNTKIKITNNNTPYVLEYNRMAIKLMEDSGFSLQDFVKKPMTNIDLAFKGLFIKNHKQTSEKVIEEIYDKLNNKQKLIETMSSMLTECYNSLFDDNETTEGNVDWDIVG